MRKFIWAVSAAALFACSGVVSTASAVSITKIDRQARTVKKQADPIKAQELVLHALSFLKTKYTWGGKTPETGFDCSGFVRHVFNTAMNKPIHGTSAELYRLGRHVKKADLQAGDLVFFNTRGKPKSHVGIYIGEGRFVHALNERKGVRIDRLSNSYYAKRYEGAKSLI